MKKSNSLLEEHFLKENNHFFGCDLDMQNQPQLIFVTELNQLKVTLTNFYVSRFFGDHIQVLQKEDECFYKNTIHPEDYPGFISHLKALEGLPEGNEKEIEVRVKNKRGTWKKFLFRHRLYGGMEKGGSVAVIGIAKEFKPPGKGQKKHLSNPDVEKALRKNQEKYQLLMNGIEEGFCIIEILFDIENKAADFLYVEANPAFKRHVSLPHPVGRTMMEIVPFHDKQWFQRYGNVVLTGESERFQQYSENLERTWFNIHAFAMGEKENRMVGVLFSDITAIKLTEEKLKISNESLEEKVKQRKEELDEHSRLLQSVFDSTNEGIMILKPIFEKNGDLVDFLYLRANKVVTDQYCSEMVGRRYLEVNPDAVEIGVFDILKRTMCTGVPEDFEIKYDRKGYNSWFRITTKRQDELLIISLEDITRGKLESQRLRENIRFKRKIAETSPDIIMILNLYTERVRYINRDIAAQPGMTKEEIDGMPILEAVPFIHPHDRDKAFEFHTQLMKSIEPEIPNVEFRIRTEENKWEWFNARGKVFMRNRKGNVYEYILLLRNIEQQKQTQQALLQAEKLSIKGEVARTLAHELRNPMASIGMAADILAKKLPEKENGELSNYIGIIKRSTGILNRLVADLLNSSNYSPLAPEKCCLAETLEKALKSAEDRIHLVGIKVIKGYSGRYYILADPEKLKIALLNIIVNASEAMNPNEGVLELEIKRVKNNFKLTITDNGCGMQKEQLEKLFDAFYTQKPHGVGIGLSSVKSILEEHDARVLVESKPDMGTSFYLTFHCFETFERS